MGVVVVVGVDCEVPGAATAILASMPLLRCPSIGQYASYMPFFDRLTVSVADWPGGMSDVLWPLISNACVIWPLFVTLKEYVPV